MGLAPSYGNRGVFHAHQERIQLLHDDTVEALLVPRSRLLLLDTVREANGRGTALAARHTRTRARHAHVEVHTKDTDTRVVLDTQVDVLGNTETKVASLREVAAVQLVLLDLETTLNDLLRLGATDSNVACNLFVTTDTEATERWMLALIYATLRTVAGLGRHGRLTGKLLKHLGRTGKAVTRLADRDVDDELINLQLLFS